MNSLSILFAQDQGEAWLLKELKKLPNSIDSLEINRKIIAGIGERVDISEFCLEKKLNIELYPVCRDIFNSLMIFSVDKKRYSKNVRMGIDDYMLIIPKYKENYSNSIERDFLIKNGYLIPKKIKTHYPIYRWLHNTPDTLLEFEPSNKFVNIFLSLYEDNLFKQLEQLTNNNNSLLIELKDAKHQIKIISRDYNDTIKDLKKEFEQERSEKFKYWNEMVKYEEIIAKNKNITKELEENSNDTIGALRKTYEILIKEKNQRIFRLKDDSSELVLINKIVREYKNKSSELEAKKEELIEEVKNLEAERKRLSAILYERNTQNQLASKIDSLDTKIKSFKNSLPFYFLSAMVNPNEFEFPLEFKIGKTDIEFYKENLEAILKKMEENSKKKIVIKGGVTN